MDAENFTKLTTILDLLDHYKKSLAVAVSQETPSSQRRHAVQLSRTLSRRSTRTSAALFRYGSGASSTTPLTAVQEALERRKTLRRFQTLLSRRRTRLRTSFPSLSEPASSKSVSLNCLDEMLQEHVVSRGLTHMFTGRSSKRAEALASKFSSDLPGGVPDFISEPDADLAPDVDWEVRSEVRRLSTHSLENLTTEDCATLQPHVLGQLFDRIVEYLQHDFEDLLEKLKEQASNSHLKQDVVSLRKKLQDAVETNDEQVQELKEMTERISDLESEGRELSGQLTVLETRIKRYQENQKELLKVAEEKQALAKECAALQERLRELSLQVSTQDTQKVTELAHDIIALKGTSQAKDEEIKSLKRELERKERMLESLNLSLAAQQMPPLESPRGDLSSRQLTPRSSAGHLFAGFSNPRRVSVKHLLTAPGPTSPEHSLSLASELQLSSEASFSRGLSEVSDKLKDALAEVERLRASNQDLKEQLQQIREEMQEKDIAMASKLEERSLELAAAREKLVQESRELHRTAEALASTKEELRTSSEALQLTTEDNEQLLSQVQGAKQMLRAAQEEHAEALACRASPATVKALEDRVAELVEHLREKAAELADSEGREKELEEQRKALQRSLEESTREIEGLSSRVERLEAQLVSTTDVAAALDAEIRKLMDLVERGDVSSEERQEAERQREALMALLEKERQRAASLVACVAQQQSLQEEQREFAANATKLQQQLEQQVAFLREELLKQEGEADALRLDLQQQLAAAQQAKTETREQLQQAHQQLQEQEARMHALTRERKQLELVVAAAHERGSELSRLNQQREEQLRQREAELRQAQQQLQWQLDTIEECVLRESVQKAEVKKLKADLAVLEQGLQNEKEEKQRLLSSKNEELRQVQQTQRAALAAMQGELEDLRRSRDALLLEAAAETEQRRVRDEYEGLKEEVARLREKNALLTAELQTSQALHKGDTQHLARRQQELVDQLSAAEGKYKRLQLQLASSNEEYRQALEDAQRQLAELQPQLAHMAQEQQRKETQYATSLQQFEESRLSLEAEVAALRTQNEEARRQLLLHAAGAAAAAGTLEKQQQQFNQPQVSPPTADKQQSADALALANERIRRENESLKAEIDQLKALAAADQEADVASVLEGVQRQLHALASDFTAFKQLGMQQLADLKGALSGTTQIFNVSYPPSVIPLINVHESRDSNNKTVNISGEPLLPCLSFAAIARGGGPPLKSLRPFPTPVLQSSRLQDWLCRWQSTCCSDAASQLGDELRQDRWLTHTQVFEPRDTETGGRPLVSCFAVNSRLVSRSKDAAQALRVRLGLNGVEAFQAGEPQLLPEETAALRTGGGPRCSNEAAATAC
ncbi:hypothetical protein Esti_001494 [Eimeria stiedai]